MENSHRTPHDRKRPTRAAFRGGALAIAAVLALGACSDDEDDASDATPLVDEDFPGDSLDAVCARLEGAEGDDREATAATLLDELIALGDEQLALNTLQMAVVDACPDWADPVNAAIDARS